MRTSTMNTVNGPVSANCAASQRSKSVAMLELDQGRGRHPALEDLQERLAALGLVPGFEGAERRDRIGDGERLGGGSVCRLGMGAGMQRLRDRPQPVEQRPVGLAQ